MDNEDGANNYTKVESQVRHSIFGLHQVQKTFETLIT
jgi:uncharacterized membrane protein